MHHHQSHLHLTISPPPHPLRSGAGGSPSYGYCRTGVAAGLRLWVSDAGTGGLRRHCSTYWQAFSRLYPARPQGRSVQLAALRGKVVFMSGRRGVRHALRKCPPSSSSTSVYTGKGSKSWSVSMRGGAGSGAVYAEPPSQLPDVARHEKSRAAPLPHDGCARELYCG